MFGAGRSYEERSTVSAAKEVTCESHDEGIVLFFILFFLKGVGTGLGEEGGGGEEEKDLMIFGKDDFCG